MKERKKQTKITKKNNLHCQTLKKARMPKKSHDNLGFPLVLRGALNYKQKNLTEKSNTEMTVKFRRDTYALYTSSSALVPLSAAL